MNNVTVGSDRVIEQVADTATDEVEVTILY